MTNEFTPTDALDALADGIDTLNPDGGLGYQTTRVNNLDGSKTLHLVVYFEDWVIGRFEVNSNDIKRVT